jgi:glycine/D-amino acid oxidase-like deaminating enzyme
MRNHDAVDDITARDKKAIQLEHSTRSKGGLIGPWSSPESERTLQLLVRKFLNLAEPVKTIDCDFFFLDQGAMNELQGKSWVNPVHGSLTLQSLARAFDSSTS